MCELAVRNSYAKICSNSSRVTASWSFEKHSEADLDLRRNAKGNSLCFLIISTAFEK